MENQNNNAPDMYGGIFDQSVEDMQTTKAAQGGGEMDPDYYRPSLNHKNVKNGVYQALIRAVPNVHDRSLQSVTKWIYFMKNPDSSNDNDKMQIDCSSNWGDKKGIITCAFFELKDSQNLRLRNLAKEQFSRKEYFWRLYQIVKDEQQPDLENQIRIFRHSKQIDELNNGCLNGNPSMGIPGCKFADPFDGRNFALHICETLTDDQKKITSYAKSQFTPPGPLVIPGMTLTKGDKASMDAIFGYLKAGSPDLGKVKAQKWDAETEEKVIKSIMTQIDDMTIFNKIYKKAYEKNYHVVSKPAENTTNDTTNFSQQASSQPAANNAGAQQSSTAQNTNQPAAQNTSQPAATVKSEPVKSTPVQESAPVAQNTVTEQPAAQNNGTNNTGNANGNGENFDIGNLDIDFSQIP